MPRIILKERTAHLASYTFFTIDVDQYKNTSVLMLYQPPRTPFPQNTYHQLPSSCEYCKVFKNNFLIEHLQNQSLQITFKIAVLKRFANFNRKALVLESLFKTLAGLQLHKKVPRQVFSCEVCEMFKNTSSYAKAPVIASVLPVAASVKSDPQLPKKIYHLLQ